MKSEFIWSVSDISVKCVYKKRVIFNDSLNHWSQGFCRLMGLEDIDARRYIETTINMSSKLFHKEWKSCDHEEKIEALKKASIEYFNLSQGGKIGYSEFNNIRIINAEIDQIIISGLRFTPDYYIVGNSYLEHGILVELSGGVAKHVQTPKYEDKYFEGNESCYGYGNYSSQSHWRLEKSRRLLRQINAMLDYKGVEIERPGCLLDVGSGYGFFRKAASENGWIHDGIEVSQYAIKAAREIFGFKTYIGELHDFSPNSNYDVITMFDVLEHLSDPLSALKNVKSLLKKNGICVIRTPNINALERVVFDQYFHSIKPEHLQYFSPKSLCHFMILAGIKPLAVNTEAHLLRGLLGWDLAMYENILQGSDIIAFGINEE
jgi:2-polyprenyl-3-methyl-5-hydroxy-6-metoxy-1,4-benzoquinol methylase